MRYGAGSRKARSRKAGSREAGSQGALAETLKSMYAQEVESDSAYNHRFTQTPSCQETAKSVRTLVCKIASTMLAVCQLFLGIMGD